MNEVRKRNLQLSSVLMGVLGEQLLVEVGSQQQVRESGPDHMVKLERRKKKRLIVENHVQEKPELERVDPKPERVYEEARVLE